MERVIAEANRETAAGLLIPTDPATQKQDLAAFVAFNRLCRQEPQFFAPCYVPVDRQNDNEREEDPVGLSPQCLKFRAWLLQLHQHEVGNWKSEESRFRLQKMFQKAGSLFRNPVTLEHEWHSKSFFQAVVQPLKIAAPARIHWVHDSTKFTKAQLLQMQRQSHAEQFQKAHALLSHVFVLDGMMQDNYDLYVLRHAHTDHIHACAILQKARPNKRCILYFTVRPEVRSAGYASRFVQMLLDQEPHSRLFTTVNVGADGTQEKLADWWKRMGFTKEVEPDKEHSMDVPFKHTILLELDRRTYLGGAFFEPPISPAALAKRLKNKAEDSSNNLRPEQQPGAGGATTASSSSIIFPMNTRHHHQQEEIGAGTNNGENEGLAAASSSRKAAGTAASVHLHDPIVPAKGRNKAEASMKTSAASKAATMKKQKNPSRKASIACADEANESDADLFQDQQHELFSTDDRDHDPPKQAKAVAPKKKPRAGRRK
ncbi:unnamed protein product [Amoebophrya sp. A120]|nr:unnamed protein product [Amoebophrya sp. A120]|eukprot:GSA120T00001464001.1